jgi:gliding motility associated protien GldN
MKGKSLLIGTVICAAFVLSAAAQEISRTPGTSPSTSVYAPTTDVYKRETIIPEKKPVPYSYIREADVMWAKDVWRVIDLRQRMNMPLRYPLEGTMWDGERYSLVALMLYGIQTEEITPYEYQPNIGWKDPFSKITTVQQIMASNRGFADSIPLDDGTYRIDFDFGNVMKFQLQEQWFFDKQHSVMKVRIIGMAPIWFDRYDEFNQPRPEPLQKVPFIVYFPQCRRLFATHMVYNPHNDAQTISYDDFFFQRRFASTIIGESNVMGNRFVQSYKIGQDVLMEADRIKDDIFVLEHDLWEY